MLRKDLIAGGALCLLLIPAIHANAFSWPEDMKVKGDFRYRYETIDDKSVTGNEEDKRDRQRLRLRIGADAKLSDVVNLNVRFASGESNQDPVSTNATLNNSFGGKTVRIDLAYFDYHPVAGLKILGGKMNNPFFKPGGSDVIWDGDLTPEGLAVQYSTSLGIIEPFINVGLFQVVERSTAKDSSMQGGQIGVNVKPSDNFSIKIGAGLFDYSEAKGRTPFFGSASGNTLTGGNYASDFSEMEGFVELGTKIGDIPVTLFGDFVTNGDAVEVGGKKYDQAWLAGFTVGKCKDANSWSFSYNYREVEKDAVVGIFTDSDSFGGGTDGKGHRVSFAYMISSNIEASATYFMNEKPLDPAVGASAKDYNRMQLDFTVKF